MGKKAKRRQRAAMNEMNAMVQAQAEEFKAKQQVAETKAAETRAQYEGSRPYEGMENRIEDMTVDMRAADFQVQQGQQQRANIMAGLRGAAGSSGIAGLAQAMANQGQLQTQQIAAGIGQQESRNQLLAAQERSRIDQLQRGARAGKESTLLGMDYGMLAGANKAYQGALANQMSGMGMKVEMHGQQAQNNWFSQATDAVTTYKSVTVCVPKGTHIDTVKSSIAIEDIKPGDVVMGYSGEPTKVLQKHEYLEDPTKERFYRVVKSIIL